MSGAEAMYAAAAIAAAGTAANYAGEKQAAGERRNILNRSFQDTQKVTDKATQLVTDEGAKYQAGQRMKDMQAQEAATFDQSQRDLAATGAGGDVINTVGDRGNVSSDFVKAKADRALTEGDRMTLIAREAARSRSPAMLRQEEGLRQADIAGRTGSMWGTARNNANAASMDAQSVTEPWWGTMGKLAQQAALMYMMGGAGGATPSAVDYSLTGAKLGDTAANAAAMDQGFILGDMAAEPSFWNSGPRPVRFGKPF